MGCKPLPPTNVDFSLPRWTMLKQWLLNDGKTEAIDVEEKYVRWSEELRSDKYKTATRTSNIQTAGYHTNPQTYGRKSSCKVRNRVRDHTSSTHQLHTCLGDPFHTSVPYLCSVPLLYIYICMHVYIEHVIFICAHIHQRTNVHECTHARKRLLCPSPGIVLTTLYLQH